MRKNSKIIATGFASPAEDFAEKPLDLNNFLVKNPTSTFFFRYEGEEFNTRSVKDGDILIVDRSLVPSSGHLVIVVCEGKFILRELKIRRKKIYLIGDEAIEDPALCGDFGIWGVVTHIIRKTI